MSAQLESVLPAFPPDSPRPLFCPPPAGDQPLLPQILHHRQGVDRVRRDQEWEVSGDGRWEAELSEPPPRPLLDVVLPRAVHAALQPKQSPTCLHTSRRGHDQATASLSVGLAPVDILQG